MPAQTIIKLRKGAAAEWDAVDPVLAAGEVGIETDTNRFKFGDGTAPWSSLAYAVADSSGTGTVDWDSILNKPLVFPPSSHSHLVSDISDFPTEFAPSAHAATHGLGGSDPVSLDASQISGAFSNLEVSGNLTINGTLTTINTQDLVVSDPMIYMGENNPGDVVDLGFVSSFLNGFYQHTGLVRDATDGVWKLFEAVIDEPTSVVNFAQAVPAKLLVGDITTGTISAGKTTVSSAPTNETVVRNITLSTAAPSGGSDGDIWLTYIP